MRCMCGNKWLFAKLSDREGRTWEEGSRFLEDCARVMGIGAGRTQQGKQKQEAFNLKEAGQESKEVEEELLGQREEGLETNLEELYKKQKTNVGNSCIDGQIEMAEMGQLRGRI